MSAAALSQPHRQPRRGACRHKPRCPDAADDDADAARVVDARPELGWFLLCNGVVRGCGDDLAVRAQAKALMWGAA